MASIQGNVLDGLIEAIQMSRSLVREFNSNISSELLELRTQEMIALLVDFNVLLQSHLPNGILSELEMLINYLQNKVNQNDGEIDRLPDTSSFQALKSESGEPGRPSFIVVQEQVEGLRAIGMTWETIARMFGMSSRTLRTKRQEFKDFVDFEYCDISNYELDKIVSNILQGSPNSGERMLIGALRARKLKVQRWKIRESIIRVDPVGRSMRRLSVMRRRKYNVKCPNALW